MSDSSIARGGADRIGLARIAYVDAIGSWRNRGGSVISAAELTVLP